MKYLHDTGRFKSRYEMTVLHQVLTNKLPRKIGEMMIRNAHEFFDDSTNMPRDARKTFRGVFMAFKKQALNFCASLVEDHDDDLMYEHNKNLGSSATTSLRSTTTTIEFNDPNCAFEFTVKHVTWESNSHEV